MATRPSFSSPAATVLRTTLIALLFISAPAAAQTSLQVPLQFDFINPGAKSLSLAGAFVGLADDATASFANPAGLTFLDPEVSVEFRGGPVNTPYLKGGRTSGTPTGIGIDTTSDPVFANSASRQSGVSYVSLVHPIQANRFVVAGYRHELASIDQTFSSDGVFGQDPAEFAPRRDVPQDGRRRVDITGYGVAGAYKPRQSVSIGAALVVYRFQLDSEFKRYFVSDFFQPPNRNVPRSSLFTYSAQRGSDVSIAPVVGVTVDRGPLRMGAIYRSGASFSFDTLAIDDSRVATGVFRVPHTTSVGASYRRALIRRNSEGDERAVGQLLFTGEVTHVSYARLNRDFVSSQAIGQESDFRIDSGTQLHAAVQYSWLRDRRPPILLRGGAWFDPDHSVRFTPASLPGDASGRIKAEVFRAALGNGKDQVHATGGIGIRIKPRIELNAGFDLASTIKLFSTSLIVHIGREGS
jgi:hypothetical protein